MEEAHAINTSVIDSSQQQMIDASTARICRSSVYSSHLFEADPQIAGSMGA